LPLAGALIHPEHAGFDIQLEDEKLMKIRQRFAHPSELDAAANSPNELAYVTILWSAKEAVFKVFGEEFTFAEHIRIRAFQPGQSSLVADIEHRNIPYTVMLRHMRVLNHHVVLVTKVEKA
jgi:phosphopantetheinyl transferase (holo-ACP synthase)